ncbi:hypothetical protein CRE_14133 [Caenorhabditis remanei]|nr:hypothetical protein CRE_14133 [Caenorhabditis remanei]
MTNATVMCTSLDDWLTMAEGNGDPEIQLGLKSYHGLKFKYRIGNVNPQARYVIRLLFTRESDHPWNRNSQGIGFWRETKTFLLPDGELSFQHIDVKSGEELLREEVYFEKIFFENREKLGNRPQRNPPNYIITLTCRIKYFVSVVITNAENYRDTSTHGIQFQYFIAVNANAPLVKNTRESQKIEDRHDSAPPKRRPTPRKTGFKHPRPTK